jgi:hypothetical protein
MNACVIKRQHGQATSELVAAMTATLPLVLGVIYLGKYSDIKHETIQASRYAAFERALDPHDHENDTAVQNETVARFFADGGQHTIGFEDQATAATANDENPVWGEVNGDPMIGQYSDVSVALSSQSISDPVSSAPLGTMNETAKLFNGLVADRNPLDLNTGVSATEADVSVKVANIAHFKPLSNINLSIGATTVIAADPWNAGGTQDVANHFASDPLPPPAVPLRVADYFFNLLPGGSGAAVKDALNTLAKFFVDTGLPDLGCVKPDVVPDSVAKGVKYDPTNTDGDNQCY